MIINTEMILNFGYIEAIRRIDLEINFKAAVFIIAS